MTQLLPLGWRLNVAFSLGDDGRIFSNKFFPDSVGTHLWDLCSSLDGSQERVKEAFLDCVTEWKVRDDVRVTLVRGRNKLRLSLCMSPLRTSPRTFEVHGRLVLDERLLTPTEKQILAVVAEMEVQRIAEKRGVKPPTVRRTIARLKEKLNAKTDAALGVIAANYHLVE